MMIPWQTVVSIRKIFNIECVPFVNSVMASATTPLVETAPRADDAYQMVGNRK
jgi:hypothetical protein